MNEDEILEQAAQIESRTISMPAGVDSTPQGGLNSSRGTEPTEDEQAILDQATQIRAQRAQAELAAPSEPSVE